MTSIDRYRCDFCREKSALSRDPDQLTTDTTDTSDRTRVVSSEALKSIALDSRLELSEVRLNKSDLRSLRTDRRVEYI